MEGLIGRCKNMELFNKSHTTLILTLPQMNSSVSSLSDNVLIKICEAITKVACEWLKFLVGNKIVFAMLGAKTATVILVALVWCN